MNIPCPHCQSFVVPGAQSCGVCGNTLLREAVPGASEPVCAVHPELASLHACGRCGSFACAKCLRQSERGEPLCATCHGRIPAGALPWDRRDELGTLRAFWDTCLDVMFRPMPTFAGMRQDGSIGSSMGFAMLCSLVSIFTTALVYMAFMSVFPVPDSAMESDNVSPTGFRMVMAGMFGAWIVLAPVMGLIATLLSSSVDHLLLKMAGTEAPFSVTLRGNALSQAPLLMGLIPICSMYVTPFWTIGVRVVAYQGLHRTSWGKAALGALAGPVLSCVVCGGGYVALLMATLGTR
ncbi:YIP1 family protein [Pyxidicoccus xibeiensis]|uniref:YIP1 family protein n=1 Tax=Pyxidicoccus xibeiensis TaxID=2906759 RepID=UPI0020A819DC|nr:YIP1 family protein [Pyxidicoccus xibeiensis]MCP3143866.1 YIP1 family protein [Pyxidicoccus xibeiensis]